jgi:carbon storage regulator CsrA
MLVLSRKPGQKLQIGDDITITVLEVHGQVLRLGIEAPRDVRVLRAELQDWHRPEVVSVARKRLPALVG